MTSPVILDQNQPIPVEKTPENIQLPPLNKETLLIILSTLKQKFETHHKNFSERQQKVKELNDLQVAINNATGEDGKLKCDKDSPIFQTLKAAKEKHNLHFDEDKKELSKDARERLLENIRMSISNHQVLNDEDIRAFSRFEHDFNHAYQFAMKFIETHKQAVSNHSRHIAK